MNIYYRNLNENYKDVTGSAHLVSFRNIEGEKDLNILMDYGMVQDNKLSFTQLYQLNGRKMPLDWSIIDYIVISHSNSDHIALLGRIPGIEEFKGKILMTALCADGGKVIVCDSAFLHCKEVDSYNKKKKGRNYIPFMTTKSAEDVMSTVQGYDFDKEIKLNSKISLYLKPAGHIQGASMIKLVYKDGYDVKTLLYTGDTSGDRREVPFTKKPDLTKEKVDFLITENTYNDKLIDDSIPIEEQLEKHIMKTCVGNRKDILIPVFSLSRSTSLLYYLKKAYENNPKLKEIKIFLCSPMACKCHAIAGKEDSFNFYDDKWKEEKDLWKWKQVEYVESFQALQRCLEYDEPCIRLASSGMLSGGYSSYLAMKLLPTKHNLLLFCGYQSEGTDGWKLLNGEQKTITMTDMDKKVKVPIKADIDFISGCSSHADYRDLISMFSKMEKKKLKKILCVHGNIEGFEFFKEQLRKEFKTQDIIFPKYNQEIKLC